MLKRPKISKVTCDICFKQDDFFLCAKCFSLYLEKSISFKLSTNTEKNYLKSAIQEILTKNYQNFLIYNHKILKINTIEKLKKNLKQTSSALNIKQNIINSISNEIKKKKENLSKFREILENVKKKHKFISEENLTDVKETELSLNWKKIQIAKILMKIFFLNSIDAQEYFEMQEYVKPEYNKNSFNETRKNSLKENDFKEFDKIPNILSFSDSFLFRIKDTKEYEIKYEKFIKFKQNIFKNKMNIFRLNSFIFSLISGLKYLSSIFDISLPYEIQQIESFLILNPFNEKIYNLYLPYEINLNSDPEVDKTLNEILQGYIYLDINLKFLTNLLNLRENKNELNYKIYKKCISFRNLHMFFTPDLNDFLNVKCLIPEEDEFYFHHVHMSDDYKFMDMEIVGHMKNEDEEYKVEIQTVNLNLKTKNEVDGYVLIENYFS
jgi:hypothetical protein